MGRMQRWMQVKVTVVFALVVSLNGQAQDFPTRPITLLVPYSRGLASDIAMRALADAAGRHLGQRVEVRNVPGSDGMLGPNALAKEAAGDGYLISQMPQGVFRLPHQGRVKFDPRTDFTWIIGVTGFAYGVAVKSTSAWKSWDEFIAAARESPEKITYTTTSTGGTHHKTMEAIAVKAGIRWTHLPSQDGAKAVEALLGEAVDAFASSTGWGDLIAAGKIRMLVSWSAARPKLWPEVPTLMEFGYDLVVDGPYGLAGPRNMDPNVARKLHDAFKEAMKEQTYLATLDKLGQEPWYRDSQEYARYAEEEFERQRNAVARERGS